MKRILLVDDSRFMLNMIGDFLRGLGYDVTTVDNSNDALKKISSELYDLVMTDMNMPVIDGVELSRQIRALQGCRFIPIVMISAEKNEEKIALAKKVGVSTFLSKPIKEAQLKTILHITLNKRMSPRIPLKLEISYGENLKFSNYEAAYTFNVSLGGVFVETNKPLSPGERVDLKLFLGEGNAPVSGQARVAWINSAVTPCNDDHPPGMGLEFLVLENERQLQKFLQSGAWKR